MHEAYDSSLEFLEICLGNSNGKIEPNAVQFKIASRPVGQQFYVHCWGISFDQTFNPKH